MADVIMYVTREELDALPSYPAASGGPLEETPVGFLWKRKDRGGDPWLIGEWTGKVGQGVRIIWREARVCTIQERIRMIREEKLAEFSSAYKLETDALMAKVRELQASAISLAQQMNDKDRELVALQAFKQSMIDQALALMTSPLYAQVIGTKGLEERVKALEEAEEAKITKASDKKMGRMLCSIVNVVQHWVDQRKSRDAGVPQEIVDALKECKDFMGVA